MVVLKLHFPEEMVNFEAFDDVLGVLNRGIKDEADQFKSRTAWMRGVLRRTATGYNQSRRMWESTREVSLADGTRIRVPSLPFESATKLEGDDDGCEGELIGLPIGDLQFKYLVGATQWENAMIEHLGLPRPKHTDTAAFCRNILLLQLLGIWSIIDDEQMKLEESELGDEEIE